MKIYILRHGDAVEHGDPRYKETERPLTPKGIQRTRELAHALRMLGVDFDLVLSSPLTRARQTADIVARRLKMKVRLTDALSPSGSMKGLIEELHAAVSHSGSVLLVGHEPYLSSFVSLLCTGGGELDVKLKKGALVRLEAESLQPGKCAVLEWLVQPRLFGSRSARGGSE